MQGIMHVRASEFLISISSTYDAEIDECVDTIIKTGT